MSHPFKEVELNQLGLRKIDEEIADLVMDLCNMGWITSNSCQDNVFGRVWLSFYYSKYASDFMELIAANSKEIGDCVLNATTQGYDQGLKKLTFNDRWWVDSYVDTRNAEDGEWLWDISIRISIRFPRSHLEEVKRIVREEVATNN